MLLILSGVAVVFLIVVPTVALIKIKPQRSLLMGGEAAWRPNEQMSQRRLHLIRKTKAEAPRPRSYERTPLAIVHPFIHPFDAGFYRNRLQGYLVAGHHQHNRHGLARTETYRYLNNGQPLRMVREPDVTSNPNAICLYAEHGYLRGVDLGFFRGPRADQIAQLMNKGACCEARVLRVTSGLFGRNRRLFIEVNLLKSAPRIIQA